MRRPLQAAVFSAALACAWGALAADPVPRITRPQEKARAAATPRFVPIARPSPSPTPEEGDAPVSTPTPAATATPAPPTGGNTMILVPVLPPAGEGAPIDWRNPDAVRSLRFRMVTDEEMTRIKELAERIRPGAPAQADGAVEIPEEALALDPTGVPRELEFKGKKR